MKTEKFIKEFLLKEDNLVDLLSRAFYPSPWFMGVIRDEYKHLINPQSKCREDKWADVLRKGGKMTVIVNDSGEEEKHDIELQDIIDAFEQMIMKHPKMYARLIEGDADFYDADAVIQIAVFGELTYG